MPTVDRSAVRLYRSGGNYGDTRRNIGHWGLIGANGVNLVCGASWVQLP